MGRKITRLLVAAVAAVMGVTGLAATPAAAEPDPGTGCTLPVRTCVVNKARAELTASPRNREQAPNCSWYSGFWQSGDLSTCQTTGGIRWRSVDWCANFVKYVWVESRAGISGIDAFAGSFYRANSTNGRYKPKGTYTPQPGDAVLFDWDNQGGGTNGWGIDHVGIVESYSKTGTLITIEGNTTSDSGSGPEGVYRRTRNLNNVVGFVTPT